MAVWRWLMGDMHEHKKPRCLCIRSCRLYSNTVHIFVSAHRSLQMAKRTVFGSAAGGKWEEGAEAKGAPSSLLIAAQFTKGSLSLGPLNLRTALLPGALTNGNLQTIHTLLQMWRQLAAGGHSSHPVRFAETLQSHDHAARSTQCANTHREQLAQAC